MWRRSRIVQRAVRLLSRADDDVVGGQHLRAAIGADVQAGIVDALVLDAAEHYDVLRLQRQAMHPAGRLVETPAGTTRRSLQQPHLAVGRLGRGAHESASRIERRVDAPFVRPSRDVGRRRRW